MLVYALIDYDNVKTGPDRTATETALNLGTMVNSISNRARAILPSAAELVLRFYGGWTYKDGTRTQLGQQLVQELARCRGRRNGVVLRPSLAVSVAAQPGYELRGTYRADQENGQKMVDSMIVVDALYFARIEQSAVAIWSDDDDLVPAVLAGASLKSKRSHLILFRRERDVGDAVNDAFLQTCMLTIDRC